ncbi:MAG: lipid kinase [Fimbriimonadaceae bacterium]
MSRKAVLFVNSKSRRGQEWFEAARDALELGGLDLARAEAFAKPSDISPAVERAIREKVPLIVLGGGDGTFSANAAQFIGSESVLGILPLGTGNALARDLGIEANLAKACEVILAGNEASIDLGVVEDGYFINVVTVGLTTRIAEELTNEAKKRFGRFAYLFAILRALPRARAFQAKVTADGKLHEFDTMQLVIGSGRFHAGPFPVAPDAAITDGRLNIYALASRNRWDLLKMALRMPGGRHVEMQEVPAFNATGGLLETMPVQRVNVDGEVELRTPLKFGIAPAALRVLVPSSFLDREESSP